MADGVDHLARILTRKRVEVARRLRRASFFEAVAATRSPGINTFAEVLRRRPAEAPRVIAEVKLRSPSAGMIRERIPGELVRIARGYERATAAAVSVLCDGPGFGGSPLDLRRVANAVRVPVLFKEFVLDPVQIDVARAVGASFVLLLVRALDDRELSHLVTEVRARGLEPVVEAADARELSRALRTEATVIGINARDLRSFHVDAAQAAELVEAIPPERVAVFMSGVRSAADLARVSRTRADAVLIGEGLMRADDPGARLTSLLSGLDAPRG